MKEINKVIEDIILDSEIPVHEKWQTINYFQAVWYDFYTHDSEPEFDTVELREFWFYLKVLCLSKIVSRRNKVALMKLSRELNRNHKKFENPNYKIDSYKTKEEMYANL